MHCCNINKSRRGDFFLVHLGIYSLYTYNVKRDKAVYFIRDDAARYLGYTPQILTDQTHGRMTWH